LPPALQVRLERGRQSAELRVGMDRGAARVRLGDDLYLVRYRPAVQRMDFTLTLHSARQVKDPGSDRPAAFESDVTLTWQQDGATRSREQTVSMNHTLDHGRFKVYQTNYRMLVGPATGEPLRDGDRPVSLSGLTVAHDPGLWLKYAGSLIVTLGIATMFYMKAYFFGRGGPSAGPPLNGQ
jgi:cytochrome c biogenesis protein ResB